VEAANEGVHDVSAQLAHVSGFLVETAFLECSPPTLADAVQKLAGSGASRIVVLPYFLTLGIHLQRDLPRIADQLRNIYPTVRIEIGRPLEGHPGLVDILMDRSKEALNASQTD
jgi:sirohydrochlorin ferrochelatase